MPDWFYPGAFKARIVAALGDFVAKDNHQLRWTSGYPGIWSIT